MGLICFARDRMCTICAWQQEYNTHKDKIIKEKYAAVLQAIVGLAVTKESSGGMDDDVAMKGLTALWHYPPKPKTPLGELRPSIIQLYFPLFPDAW